MVSPEMITSIKPVPNVPQVTYFIEGNSIHGTEKKVYHVSFSTDESYVSCSCPWFRRNRSLCKHFFAVIENGYRSFKHLTPLYRNHPLHIIDKYLSQQENKNDFFVRKFTFSRSYFEYILAGAFVLSYYQQKPFFLFFLLFFSFSILTLGLGYKYEQQIPNKFSDRNIECKRQKLVNTAPNRIRNLCV